MPLSGKGLCDADTMAAGAPSRADHHATSGVGATPSSATSAPSDARPALSAASSSGPERRVSRPTAKRSPPSTRAAARPSARASSGVSSALATPRTPSVPNFSMGVSAPGSTLGVLGSLAGLLQPVLLGLLLTLVTREEPGPLERGAHLRVDLHQRPGDPQAKRPGLAGHAAAVQGPIDVVRLVRAGQAQRLREDHLVRLGREVGGDVAAVDGDGAGAGTDPDPGDGALAAAGGLRERSGHRDGVLRRWVGGRGPRRGSAAAGRRGDGWARRTP